MLKLIMIFMISILLFGCGSNSKKNPPKPEGAYSFFNATTPLIIKEPTTIETLDENNNTVTVTKDNIYTIKVQLLEFGLVKPGELIQMKPFSYKYGFITNNVVTTNNNGEAEFEYNVPENFSEIRGQHITIEAIYLDPRQNTEDQNTNLTQKDILLTQNFILNFK